MRWLEAEYRDFNGVPRTMLCSGAAGTFLFCSRFDPAQDRYRDYYEVYRLPALSAGEPCASWFGLETRAIEHLDDLPVTDFPFDAERRVFLPYDPLEKHFQRGRNKNA